MIKKTPTTMREKNRNINVKSSNKMGLATQF
jgi:hypothetical protein